MKKWLLGALGLVAFAALGLVLLQDRIIERVIERQAVPRMSGEMFTALPDGLHVMLCGAGSPLPDPKRSGPCTVVVAGQRSFVVDIGSGAAGNINLMGVPMASLEAVLLTHFHSDHIDGLGELMLQRWAGGGATRPLPVHGPEGVERVVQGFNLAYEQDFGYRVAHHGADLIPPTGAGGTPRPFTAPTGTEAVTVIDEGGLKVSAFAVVHEPIAPAIGYRFDYGGRSVVISGDTAKSENLARHAQGADLLLHEALSPEVLALMRAAADQAGNTRMVTIFDDILDYHTSPVEAAEIAREAGVGHLVFHHIVPALPARPLERMFMRGVDKAYAGPVTLGEDGLSFSLPAGGTSITVSQRLP